MISPKIRNSRKFKHPKITRSTVLCCHKMSFIHREMWVVHWHCASPGEKKMNGRRVEVLKTGTLRIGRTPVSHASHDTSNVGAPLFLGYLDLSEKHPLFPLSMWSRQWRPRRVKGKTSVLTLISRRATRCALLRGWKVLKNVKARD